MVYAWLFVCYLQNERRFVVHSIAVNSFVQALDTHSQTFPSHNVIFTMKVDVSLSSFICDKLGFELSDPKTYIEKIQQLLTANLALMPLVQVQKFRGFVPLSYSTTENKLTLAMWKNDRYINANAFILSEKLIMLFNNLLYPTSILDLSKLFQS